MLNVKAELVGTGTNRKVIRLYTSTPLAHLDKRLSGASFSATHKAWQLQLSMDACIALRQEFGEALEIGERLYAWAAQERLREAKMRKLSKKHNRKVKLKRLERLAPRLAARIAGRRYQGVAAKFIAQGRYVLLADAPGLGKTTEILGGILESGVEGPHIIFAPVAALETAWAREIRNWLPGHEAHVLSSSSGSIAQRDYMISLLTDPAHNPNTFRTWIITNPQALQTRVFWECKDCRKRWAVQAKPKAAVVDCEHDLRRIMNVVEHNQPSLFQTDWGAVVMDESQNILIANGGTPTQVRTGATLLPQKPDCLRIAGSGTPMRGNSLKLWGTLNWLRPKEYSSKWTWIERFWEVNQGGYGGSRMIAGRKPDMEERLNEMLQSISLRRTRQEVYPDLPAKEYPSNAEGDAPPAIWLPMDPKQGNAYRDMEKMGVAELESGTLTAIGGLAVLTRLRQFANGYGQLQSETRKFWCKDQDCHKASTRHQHERFVEDFYPAPPSNKLDWTLQFLTDMGILAKESEREPQGKVVIATQFRQWLVMAQTQLTLAGVASRRIDGTIGPKQRDAAQDLFNDPHSGIDVLFLQTQTGGTAITLDAADDMIIWDETHVPDDQEQLEARIDNRRPEEKIAPRRYWYLKSLGTIDEAIARANAELDREQKSLLDGARGVAYVRSVTKYLGGKR